MMTAVERLLRMLSIQAGDIVGTDEEEGSPDYEKVCDVEYGDRVVIEWQGELLDGVEDRGYVLGWPTHYDTDANMGGVVHIVHPQNPGGKGDVESEWVTLHELRTNPDVRRVRKEEGSDEVQS